ncbi:hypothetical protein [Saccharospirillum mangrovi]|uniref:hypothetical protein n=1 Tax=Saccharospirillum mangrovi TaxID=2161747 RepID=UPI000D3876B6|nr:hypothetical protein [Saccharospirillum mangrovi]
MRSLISRIALLLFIPIWISACNSEGSSGPSGFFVGGTISGLSSDGLTLANNGGDQIEVVGKSFRFPTRLADGSAYQVSMVSQSEKDLCQLENVEGIIASGDVTTVSIDCRSWHPALSLTDINAGDDDSEFAFDLNADGRGALVWTDDTDGSSVWVRNYFKASGWTSPVKLYQEEDTPINSVAVAIGDSGNAVVVWDFYDSDETSAGYLNAAVYRTGVGWGEPEQINAPDESHFGYYGVDPEVVFSDSNQAIVLWREDVDSTQYLWSKVYDFDEGWGSIVVLADEEVERSGFYIRVASDNQDHVIAVWKDYESASSQKLWGIEYTSEFGWSEPTLISNIGGSFELAMNRNGRALLVSSIDGDSQSELWANEYSLGEGWSPPHKILGHSGDAEVFYYSVPFSLALNDNDKGFVVVSDSITDITTDITKKAWLAYDADTGWSEINVFSAEQNAKPGEYIPVIAMDDFNNVILILVEDRSNIALAGIYSAKLGWGNFYGLGGNVSLGARSILKIDSNNNAVAVGKNRNTELLDYLVFD